MNKPFHCEGINSYGGREIHASTLVYLPQTRDFNWYSWFRQVQNLAQSDKNQTDAFRLAQIIGELTSNYLKNEGILQDPKLEVYATRPFLENYNNLAFLHWNRDIPIYQIARGMDRVTQVISSLEVKSRSFWRIVR
jgi:hypothetical protein